jgi:hypothetical protein
MPWCRATAIALCIAVLTFSSSGCGGPKIPPEELGEVLTELPKLPEAEKPYQHPELVADGLDVPAAKSEAEAAVENAATDASAETTPAATDGTLTSPESSTPAAPGTSSSEKPNERSR